MRRETDAKTGHWVSFLPWFFGVSIGDYIRRVVWSKEEMSSVIHVYRSV